MTRLDALLVQRRFSKAAATYDSAATIQTTMIENLLNRLDELTLSPKRIVDIGCGTGNALGDLSARYPTAQGIAIDIALPMLEIARQKSPAWQPILADMNRLPLTEGSCDLVISNAALQWSDDPVITLAEWWRLISTDGRLCVNTFGPNTLFELRLATTAVDQRSHVHAFPNLTTLTHALERLGATDIEAESTLQVMHHDDLRSVLASLKAIGATNADRKRSTGLMGKNALDRLTRAYDHFRQAQGLPVTWEILTLRCQRS